MSSFTNWNGPSGSGAGPAASDWRELIQNYKDAIIALGNKQDKLTFDTVPTRGSLNPATSGGIENITSSLQQQITDLLNLLSRNYQTKDTADSKYQLKISGNIATQSFVDDAISNIGINDYLKKSDLSSQQVISDIESDVLAIKEALSKDTVEKLVLKATGHIEGLVNAFEQIQFTDKSFSASIGGSDIDGIYYILGMLVDKAGTAYVKFVNTQSFSAVINFAVTPEWKGALSVTTDCELKGLKFKIVSCTASDGSKHAYLAIQSSEWLSHFASSDGYGLFDHLDFFGSGINFIPVDSVGYKPPVDNCKDVCNCMSGKGFSFSELATVMLGKQIYRESDNPYVTANDLKVLDNIGTIVFWPEYDEATGIAINVPAGYHACDGTDVLDTDDVADAFKEKFTKYPLVDYSIIKTKCTINIDTQKVDVTAQSLAEAVCALHGISFYKRVSELPDTGKANVPVVVQIGNKYAVYTYTASDGWKKYSTEFNDINKTIGAVTAVIAAEHGADVYTVYNSIAELPNTDVETGALAIVFDGIAYTVFKYNGSAWEVQA